MYGHLIKLSWERGSPLAMHTHDYPELFWLDEGTCRHRVNGTEELLRTGDLVFIRAKDCHQFFATPAGRFTMTNLECQPALIRELMRRHLDPFASWFHEKSFLPNKLHLEERQLRRLQQLAADLATRFPNALHVEGFCLDLARLLTPAQPFPADLSLCPDWLRDALLKTQSTEVFSQGVSGLMKAAGRSHEHVARLCQRFLCKTPTEIIEECRMLHAEKQLRLTSASILSIALECGYSTTAQFHRAFKERYRRTPLRYRWWIRGS